MIEKVNDTTIIGNHNKLVLENIKAILEHLLQQILEKSPLTLSLNHSKNYNSSNNININSNNNNGKYKINNGVLSHCSGKSSSYEISFPGKSETEAKKFSMFVCILKYIVQTMESKTTITKRDLYYRNVELFESQIAVDTMVDDISFTFGVPRNSLGIIGGKKGQIIGNMIINFKKSLIPKNDDEFLNDYKNTINNCSIDLGAIGKPILVPYINEISYLNMRNISYILIIEKEAVFHHLVSIGFHTIDPFIQGLLITGKGYPDIATREILFYISNIYPHIPIYIVVDADPHGLEICSTYIFGSKALAHENKNLAVSNAKWIGVDILDFPTGMLKCSINDRNKAIKLLLNNNFWLSHSQGNQWRIQLQRMLFLNRKAEMNIVNDSSNGISEYLHKKLKSIL